MPTQFLNDDGRMQALQALAESDSVRTKLGLLEDQYAAAQRSATAPLGGVQGQGMASTAPGLANVFANIVERRSGKKSMRDIEKQIAELGKRQDAAGFAKLIMDMQGKPQADKWINLGGGFIGNQRTGDTRRAYEPPDKPQKPFKVEGLWYSLDEQGQPYPIVGADTAADAARTIASGRAEGAAIGRKVGEEKIDLPRYAAHVQDTVSIIDRTINHPGLPYAVGKSSVLPVPPGSDAADFMGLLNQLQGRNFLAAFDSLRGGGQITETEGQKAQEAMARLARTQSETGFKESLSELKTILEAGLARKRNTYTPGLLSVDSIQQQPGQNSVDAKRKRLMELRAKAGR